VFRMDAAKVDQDVAYVTMVVHVCCKLLFPMFHLFFQTYVASVFIWMLCMVHTYVASVLFRCCVCFYNGFKCFSGVFANVLDACFKCFINLQMYVASVVYGCFKSRSGVACPSSPSVASPRRLLLLLAPIGHPPPPPRLLNVGDVRGRVGPTRVRETDCRHGHPDAPSVRTSGC
jgi:hypothetical protein